MRRILYFATIIGLFFMATACEQEGTIYDLTDKIEASFPSTIVNYQMVAEDGNKIVVEMWRGNTRGAASVPVTVSDETGGIFSPEKEQFDFADGEAKAYLAFTYPDLNQFGGERYEIELEIADENQVSPGGRSTVRISAQRRLTFESIGTGSFTSDFYGESWPQEVLKAAEADYYRLPDCYYSGFHIEFSVENGQIGISKQPVGEVDPDYGMISWDPRYPDESEIDGKTFTFVVAFVVDAGSFGKYYEELVMP